MLVWGIWGFFVLKKIEDWNRFFDYETNNIIIYEVKDMSSFILRFLKLDLLLWLRYSDGKYNKVIKILTVSFVLRWFCVCNLRPNSMLVHMHGGHIWGVISANINFQILLCHSPMLLFSFVRNSYMHVRILLFPFEFCYSLFWFYYAVMNSFIQFPIPLFTFE